MDSFATDANARHARMMRAFLILLLCISPCAADNGHLLTSYKTDEYNIAVFIEPWPVRVGEAQLRALVTDHFGNLIKDPSILPFGGALELLSFDAPTKHEISYSLNGVEQPPITIEILPKANVLFLYWEIWLFLLFGLLCIILREKLAKHPSRRYPNR
jgi:hypothetical protein